MKTVYFIRHGKSSWDNSHLSDKERPLKRRGEKDAEMMAKILRKQGIIPDLIVSSPARRALDTAKIYAGKLDYPEKKIQMNDLLYFEGIKNILHVIHQLDSRHRTVFIFGHNPDFTTIANKFSQKAIDNVPTNGVVGVTFKTDAWQDASFSNGTLVFFDYPSHYK